MWNGKIKSSSSSQIYSYWLANCTKQIILKAWYSDYLPHQPSGLLIRGKNGINLVQERGRISIRAISRYYEERRNDARCQNRLLRVCSALSAPHRQCSLVLLIPTALGEKHTNVIASRINVNKSVQIFCKTFIKAEREKYSGPSKDRLLEVLWRPFLNYYQSRKS